MNFFSAPLFVLLAITAASSDPHGQGHHHQVPHYHFEYGVHDPHTNDIKYHWEQRDHDHVKGGYTLKEADGTQRIVEYSSGPHTGFQAVVKHVGHAHHPAHYGGHHHGHGGHNHDDGGASFTGTTHWGFGSGR